PCDRKSHSGRAHRYFHFGNGRKRGRKREFSKNNPFAFAPKTREIHCRELRCHSRRNHRQRIVRARKRCIYRCHAGPRRIFPGCRRRNDFFGRSRRTAAHHTSAFVACVGKRRIHQSGFFKSAKNRCSDRGGHEFGNGRSDQKRKIPRRFVLSVEHHRNQTSA